jgi:hypothetical protein
VLGPQVKKPSKRFFPGLCCLVREAGDQVKTDIVEACGTQMAYGFQDILSAVHAPGGRKLPVVK